MKGQQLDNIKLHAPASHYYRGMGEPTFPQGPDMDVSCYKRLNRRHVTLDPSLVTCPGCIGFFNKKPQYRSYLHARFIASQPQPSARTARPA